MSAEMIIRVELEESGYRSVLGRRRSIAAAAHPVGRRVPRRRRGLRGDRRISPGSATALTNCSPLQTLSSLCSPRLISFLPFSVSTRLISFLPFSVSTRLKSSTCSTRQEAVAKIRRSPPGPPSVVGGGATTSKEKPAGGN